MEPLTDTYVPATVPRTIAALIAGRPYRAFLRQYIDTGLVDRDDAGDVITASLTIALGQRVTHERYCAALFQRAAELEMQRIRRRAVVARADTPASTNPLARSLVRPAGATLRLVR